MGAILDDTDWGDSLDDSDGADWERFLSGPDDNAFENNQSNNACVDNDSFDISDRADFVDEIVDLQTATVGPVISPQASTARTRFSQPKMLPLFKDYSISMDDDDPSIPNDPPTVNGFDFDLGSCCE